MTNREKIDRIYESAQKIDQVYDVWATKHKLTLYEMMMFYEIFQKENREITQKELSMKLGAPKTSVNSLIKKQLNAGYITSKQTEEATQQEQTTETSVTSGVYRPKQLWRK